jgi:ATP-dependent protease ClpP protease subunit
VAMGMAANMAAILLQMGKKRLVTPNTFILIHEVSQIAVGKLSEIIDAAMFGSRIQERLLSILGRSLDALGPPDHEAVVPQGLVPGR